MTTKTTTRKTPSTNTGEAGYLVLLCDGTLDYFCDQDNGGPTAALNRALTWARDEGFVENGRQRGGRASQ